MFHWNDGVKPLASRPRKFSVMSWATFTIPGVVASATFVPAGCSTWKLAVPYPALTVPIAHEL